jgi:hypothetical protein
MRSVVRRIGALGGVAVLAAACGEPTTPFREVTVRVAADTVRARRSSSSDGDWASFEVATVVRNGGTRTVYLPPCVVALERQEPGGEWQLAWRPYCAITGDVRGAAILPGTERRIGIDVIGALHARGGPRFPRDVVVGRYRVVFAVSDDAELARSVSPQGAGEVRSGPFVVTE